MRLQTTVTPLLVLNWIHPQGNMPPRRCRAGSMMLLEEKRISSQRFQGLSARQCQLDILSDRCAESAHRSSSRPWYSWLQLHILLLINGWSNDVAFLLVILALDSNAVFEFLVSQLVSFFILDGFFGAPWVGNRLRTHISM